MAATDQYLPGAMDVADPIAWLESAVSRLDELTRAAVTAYAVFEETRSAVADQCDALLESDADLPHRLLSVVREHAHFLGGGSSWGSGGGPGGNFWVLDQLEDLVAVTGLVVRKARGEPLTEEASGDA